LLRRRIDVTNPLCLHRCIFYSLVYEPFTRNKSCSPHFDAVLISMSLGTKGLIYVRTMFGYSSRLSYLRSLFCYYRLNLLWTLKTILLKSAWPSTDPVYCPSRSASCLSAVTLFRAVFILYAHLSPFATVARLEDISVSTYKHLHVSVNSSVRPSIPLHPSINPPPHRLLIPHRRRALLAFFSRRRSADHQPHVVVQSSAVGDTAILLQSLLFCCCCCCCCRNRGDAAALSATTSR
jgi:hypothetical protein